MMKSTRPLLSLLSAALLALFAVSCSDDSGVTDVPDPAPVSFEPPSGSIDATAFVPLHFRAVDAEGEPIEASYSVQDEFVELTAEFVWAAEGLGIFTVKASVERGGQEYEATWTITASETGADSVPPVTVVSAEPGSLPGSVEVVWDRALVTGTAIPVQDYLVYYSEEDIPADIPDGVDFVVAEHDAGVIRQRVLVEGLRERVMHFFRVVTRDRLERTALTSTQRQSESTGHYDVHGTIIAVLPAPSPVLPMEGVVVDLAGNKALTDADGHYEILGVSDLLMAPLFVQDGGGSSYYTITTPELRPDPVAGVVDFQWDLPLFPRGDVAILEFQEPGEYPEFISQLEFLMAMTSNELGTQDFYHWEQYPIEVYAPSYTYEPEPGVVVDYDEAIDRAIALWNQSTGEELLVRVDARVDYGCNVSMDLATGSGLLGEVRKVRPSGGLYEGVPELLAMRLLQSFRFQELVNRIAAHEMGHVLLLDHSPSADQLMHSSYPPASLGEPQDAEAYVARLLRYLPIGFPATGYADPEQKLRTFSREDEGADDVLCRLPAEDHR